MAVAVSLAQGLEINTPAPMLPPPYPMCEQFTQARGGDTCDTLAVRGNIPYEVFLRLNPCLDNGRGCPWAKIKPGYWYCLKRLPPSPLPPDPPHREPASQMPEPTATTEEAAEPETTTTTQAPESKPTSEEAQSTKKKPKPKPKPTTTEEPEPTTTEAPESTFEIPAVTYSSCEWGSCWKSWVKLSTKSEDYVLTSATNSCERLSTLGCTKVGDMDFPEDIKDGCDSCEKLTSGCACYQAGLYHTYTVAYERYNQ